MRFQMMLKNKYYNKILFNNKWEKIKQKRKISGALGEATEREIREI